MAERPPTPELDKQLAIIESGKAATVQDFYDWIREKGWAICEPNPDSLRNYYTQIYTQPEQLMADFFGIDRDKIEAERRALLEYIQVQHLD